jgi:hypothetical protein
MGITDCSIFAHHFRINKQLFHAQTAGLNPPYMTFFLMDIFGLK